MVYQFRKSVVFERKNSHGNISVFLGEKEKTGELGKKPLDLSNASRKSYRKFGNAAGSHPVSVSN